MNISLVFGFDWRRVFHFHREHVSIQYMIPYLWRESAKEVTARDRVLFNTRINSPKRLLETFEGHKILHNLQTQNSKYCEELTTCRTLIIAHISHTCSIKLCSHVMLFLFSIYLTKAFSIFSSYHAGRLTHAWFILLPQKHSFVNHLNII